MALKDCLRRAIPLLVSGYASLGSSGAGSSEIFFVPGSWYGLTCQGLGSSLVHAVVLNAYGSGSEGLSATVDLSGIRGLGTDLSSLRRGATLV